jgi:hypothetical protein
LKPPPGFGSQLVSLAPEKKEVVEETVTIVEPVVMKRQASATLSDTTASGLASLLGSSVAHLTEFKSLAAAFQGGFINALEFIESFARLVIGGESDIFGFERGVVEEMGRFWKGLAGSIPGEARGSVMTRASELIFFYSRGMRIGESKGFYHLENAGFLLYYHKMTLALLGLLHALI